MILPVNINVLFCLNLVHRKNRWAPMDAQFTAFCRSILLLYDLLRSRPCKMFVFAWRPNQESTEFNVNIIALMSPYICIYVCVCVRACARVYIYILKWHNWRLVWVLESCFGLFLNPDLPDLWFLRLASILNRVFSFLEDSVGLISNLWYCSFVSCWCLVVVLS